MTTMHGGLSVFWRYASVFGLGFLPIAEGNVAVPVGLAIGLPPVVAVFISVLGTTSQTLLTRAFAGWLLTLPAVARWWERRQTGRIGRLFSWQGVYGVILFGIPWLGGVPTALGSRLAGIGPLRYACWAVGGLVLHAGTLAVLIRLGLHAAAKHW